MKFVVNIERLVKQLRVTTDSETKDRILKDALLALDKKHKSVLIPRNIFFRPDFQLSHVIKWAGLAAMILVAVMGIQYAFFISHLYITPY